MAKIIIPTPLRKFTENQSTFETKGSTIKEGHPGTDQCLQRFETAFFWIPMKMFDPS